MYGGEWNVLKGDAQALKGDQEVLKDDKQSGIIGCQRWVKEQRKGVKMCRKGHTKALVYDLGLKKQQP